MDRFFRISPQWRVAICLQCQHGVWPRHVTGHLKGASHCVAAKEAARIQREVEMAAVCLDAADFQIISSLDEPISGLKLYHDGWTCTAEPNCHYTSLKISSLKVHCANKHPGARSRSKYRVQNAHSGPWAKVKCQQMFTTSHGSNYFRVGTLAANVDDSIPVDAITETRQQVRNAQRALEQRTMQELEDRQEGTEFVPFLEKMGWPTYLHGLNRQELMNMVATPNADEEPLVAIVWDAMNDMIVHSQQTVKKHASYWLKIEVVRSEAKEQVIVLR